MKAIKQLGALAALFLSFFACPSQATSIGPWAKQGTVIAAVSSDSPGQPNAFFEASGCVIVSNPCFKLIFGTTNGICYAESSDGATYTRYATNSCIVISKTNFGNAYAYPRIYKNGSTYNMAVGPIAGPIQIWTSTNLTSWSVQNANAIQDSGNTLQLSVVDIVGGTWYGYYAFTTNANVNGWQMRLATSPDGITWTKVTSNTITYEGPSNFEFHKVGSVYYGWSQITLPNIPGNTNAQFPSDIMRFYALSPTGPWTPLGTPTLYRTTAVEGVATGGGAFNITGQVADPSLVSDGTNLWIYYTADSSGGSWVICAAKAANATFAQLVAGYEGVKDIPIPTAAGLALNLNQQAADTFTGSNANPIAGNWTRVSTLSNFGTAQLLSNAAVAAVTSPQRASYYWNAQAFDNDQWSQITVTTCNGTSICGVATRESTSGAASEYQGTWVGVSGLGVNGGCRIQKFVSGTSTTLASCSGIKLSSGDSVVQASIGTTLSLYFNGVLIMTITDSSLAAGSPGFQMFAVSAATDTVEDNWTGGNVVAAAAIPTPAGTAAGAYGPVPAFGGTLGAYGPHIP
jgi:hypothetical protein